MLEEIYHNYKYKPPSLEKKKSFDLSFLKRNEANIISDLLGLYDGRNDFYFLDGEDHGIVMSRDRGTWSFIDSKEHGKIAYEISIIGKKNFEIASFQFIKKNLSWELVHRNVVSAYRGNGIGIFLLKILEESIKMYSEEEEILEINTEQIPVVTFALKNGFEFDEKSKKLFNEIISNTSNFVLKTIKHQYTSKYGYIFKKGVKIPPHNAPVVDFVKSGETISLYKKIY